MSATLGIFGCGSSGSGDLFASGGSATAAGGAPASGGTGATTTGDSAGTFGGTGGTLGGAGGTGSGGMGGGSGDGGSCDFSGNWGAYVTIPMTWAATAVLNQGSGLLQVWLRSTRTVQGNVGNDTGQLCGIQLPHFQTTPIAGSEMHGVRFLAEAFDHMPQFSFVSYLDGTEPGSAFSTDPAPIVFGVAMNDPLTDAWPPLQNLTPADDDQDRRPGITTPAEKGAGFALIRVGLALTDRASELFVASRTVSKLSGSAKTCDEIEGNVEIGLVGGSPALNSHIIGCTLESGAPCNSTQYSFADQNGPVFQPAAGTTLVMRRIPDEATCANVRGMYAAQ